MRCKKCNVISYNMIHICLTIYIHWSPQIGTHGGYIWTMYQLIKTSILGKDLKNQYTCRNRLRSPRKSRQITPSNKDLRFQIITTHPYHFQKAIQRSICIIMSKYDMKFMNESHISQHSQNISLINDSRHLGNFLYSCLTLTHQII